MDPSIRMLVTCWLVAQIVLPFTAPFPVCDLTDLLGGTANHATPLTPNTPGSRPDASYAYAPPLWTTGGRARLWAAQRGTPLTPNSPGSRTDASYAYAPPLLT